MSEKVEAVNLLSELVDAILNGTDAGREIDAGWEGEGPLAKAMVYLGLNENLEDATDAIYPEGEDFQD